MLKLKYQITTLSPILFSKESGDRNMTETFDFIPGRVILGIFASKYIKKEKLGNDAHKNEKFKELFLNDKLFFNNAYIKLEDEQVFNPTPFSIQEEKDKKGVLHDLLLKDADDEYTQTKYIGGYSHLNEDYVKNITAGKSLNFHHSRDEKTGASKEGIIFNYESINKDQLFEGYIGGDDTLIKYINENYEKEFIAYTGRSKTSQYGKIKFKFVSDPIKWDSDLDIQSKMSLTFLSDVLLYNQYGVSICSKDLFEKFLKANVSNEIKITKSFIKPTRVDNYVSIWKLKKPSEICYSAGSCFFIEGFKETDMDKLKELEINGIGERRNEGLGRIAIGTRTNENLTKLELDSEDIIRPEGLIPKLSKEFITQSIKDILGKEIKTKAITDARNFNDNNKGKMTKSLVGRLESFIKGSSGIDDFKDKLRQLRKPAKEKLEACRINNDNFYEYLLKKKISTEKFINSPHLNSLSDALLKEIYEPIDDSELNKNNYKIYYLTFFAFLRKLIKEPDLSGNRENNNE